MRIVKAECFCLYVQHTTLYLHALVLLFHVLENTRIKCL